MGRIAALKDEVAQLRISIAEADGNYMSGMASARDAAGHGFSDMAYERQATAKTWEIAKSRFEEKLPELEAELDSVGRARAFRPEIADIEPNQSPNRPVISPEQLLERIDALHRQITLQRDPHIR